MTPFKYYILSSINTKTVKHLYKMQDNALYLHYTHVKTLELSLTYLDVTPVHHLAKLDKFLQANRHNVPPLCLHPILLDKVSFKFNALYHESN